MKCKMCGFDDGGNSNAPFNHAMNLYVSEDGKQEAVFNSTEEALNTEKGGKWIRKDKFKGVRTIQTGATNIETAPKGPTIVEKI